MELSLIGYFSKTHGVKGQLVLKSDAGFDPHTLKVIFVDTAGAKAPYFLTEIKEMGSGLVLSIEDIDAVEKARPLVGREVFADASLVDEEEEPALLGFELIDSHFGSLGNIEEISDNGSQVLVSLNYKGREVILPLVDEFIVKVDEEAKKLFFNAPEGLIDVYLSASE